MAREVIYPKTMSTHDRTVYCATIIFDAFQPLWKGGILAFDLYGQLTSRDIRIDYGFGKCTPPALQYSSQRHSEHSLPYPHNQTP